MLFWRWRLDAWRRVLYPSSQAGVREMSAVVFNGALEQALNLIGVFVFAMSGALLAVRKRFDIVGMSVLAIITAIGGGVMRDLFLGATPPLAFTDPLFLLLPLAATVVTFFAHPLINRIQAAMLVFDAAGLGLFCVEGTALALRHHIGPVEAVALGALTAVGGGVIRDVLANDQPALFQSDGELYSIPAVLGSSIIVVLADYHLYGTVTAGLVALLVFALRVGALRYGWRAPRPRLTGRDTR
jgi:uncharacterized membrane protein YeiH